MRRMMTAIAAAIVTATMVTGTTAQRGGRGGGAAFGGGAHFGGGGAHFGGGGAHFGAGGAHFGGGAPFGGGGVHLGGGGVHFGGGGAHFGGGGLHFGGGAIFARHGGGGVHVAPHIARNPHFAPRIGGIHIAPHRVGRPSLGSRVHGRALVGRASHGIRPNVGRAANLHAGTLHATAKTNPRVFAAHRHLVGLGAFHPFFGHGSHPHGHLGWLGPWFWPYAYGDIFYYALWPFEYAYYDPFWYYGYDDIYAGIFSPYDYEPYVAGPHAPARMTALTHSAAESCTDEVAEVAGWPIDQIQAAVQANPQQTALLDALGNAVVKAGGIIRAHCPTGIAFTPSNRLAQMQQRLEGLVQAVDIVQPPLGKFYDSLSDEQKARFNDIGAPSGKQPTQGKELAANLQAECDESAMSFPTDKIDQVVQPNDAQRAKLDALVAANAKAADLIKASCPSGLPATPPDRLDAEGKHLQAMLAAVKTIRPPLDDFYASLSDEQKAHFNTLGRQLFARNMK